MDTQSLEKQFAKMGARLKVVSALERLAIDVRADRKGEFFELKVPERVDVQVLENRARERHLLLLAREGGQKDKFLCGHDERHWFAAAVPDFRGVGTVRTAMEALKAELVRFVQDRKNLTMRERLSRRNEAFVRQGEWFFVPAPWVAKDVDPAKVLRNEPLSRGRGSKPHRCEMLFRRGGENVYVCRYFPNGLTEVNYRRELLRNPKAKAYRWQSMRLNPEAYVRGAVSHADHATIYLGEWHRVLMNTEHQSRAKANVVFLD
ncbi:MAG: hypothetical protein KIS92_20145 [Planctomycetota bacterium]|nr:hypothetical protein [Planctomycetota bacterium]